MFKTFLKSAGVTCGIENIKLYDKILQEAIKKEFEENKIPLTLHNLKITLNRTRDLTIQRLEDNL